MTFFDLRHWVFSLKTYLAGLMALSIAFWLDLSKPYWALATVYVASQPLSGATGSKAFYRAVGTILGAAAAVVLTPNLVNAPLLLTSAISLWFGLCVYLSLLDRTPRSYVFLLAGYTTAIVAFPAVDAPETIFDLALARTEEILIGIACAAVVSTLLFPRPVGPFVAERVEIWLRHASACSRDALALAKTPADEGDWLRLAADTTEIETLATHLAFDPTADSRAVSHIESLVPRMLMMAPALSSISDRLGEFLALGDLSPDMAGLAARVREQVGDDRPLDPKAAQALRREIDARAGRPLQDASWRDLMEAGLCLRLGELMDLHADCEALAAALADNSRSLPAPLLFPIDERLARMRHDDHGAALFLVGATIGAVALCCLFWIAFSWPEGGTAATMTAITAGLFAGKDDAAPSVRSFAGWTAVGTLIAGVYLFLILPHVHSMETLALALAPAFLGFGLLMASPETAAIGVPLGLLTPSSMALQELYSADAEAFINTSLAMVGGMAFTAATMALMRPAGAYWRANRFVQANRRTLAEAAAVHGAKDEARVMGLMFDRLALLAPIVQAIDHSLPSALRELRAGFNILDAHAARAKLSPSARRRIDALLMRLARHYRQDAVVPPEIIMRAIHDALRAARRENESRVLLALVGLRCALFPHAAPPDFFLPRREFA